MPWNSVRDRKKWNDFVKTNGPRSGAFLSSWEWGEFQKATGKEIRREALEEKEEWKAAALCLKSSLPFGWRSWYCPRGPISAAGYTPEIFLSLADHLFHPLFLRAEPPREEHADFASISFGRGEDIRRSLEIQPSHTLLLSLDQSEDELLSGMHPKTRYNIHIAERKFVKIKTYSAKKDGQAALLHAFQDVWPLFKTTGSRGGFHLHTKAYYEQMLVSLYGDCEALLWTARFEDEAVAALMTVDFGKTRTYLHGASGDKHRNVMAPFLLQWSAIRDAKAKGFTWYDWWGVAPEGASEHHPWTGITRFKTGFGGIRVNYPGTFDIVGSLWKYRLYQVLRGIRRSV